MPDYNYNCATGLCQFGSIVVLIQKLGVAPYPVLDQEIEIKRTIPSRIS
jgi:hypothetical protein